MGVERLDELAAALSASARRVRSSIRPAESLVESRVNTVLSSLSDSLEDLATAVRRLKCVAENVKASGAVASLCTSWRVFEQDGELVVLRVKPETVVALREGAVVVQRGEWRAEVSGALVKLCRWNYCKEFSAADREAVARELPQITYLLRGLLNTAAKVLSSVTLCARKEAPSCARI